MMNALCTNSRVLIVTFADGCLSALQNLVEHLMGLNLEAFYVSHLWIWLEMKSFPSYDTARLFLRSGRRAHFGAMVESTFSQNRNQTDNLLLEVESTL
jgi:hypothetical protein